MLRKHGNKTFLILIRIKIRKIEFFITYEYIKKSLVNEDNWMNANEDNDMIVFILLMIDVMFYWFYWSLMRSLMRSLMLTMRFLLVSNILLVPHIKYETLMIMNYMRS